MMRSYAELKRLCDELNLEYFEKGRKSKRPFIDALQKHYLSKMDHITSGLNYRLSIESPQLALLSNKLKNSERTEIYESEDWIFEEKFNGLRMEVENLGDGLEVHGRNESVTDFLPVDYSDKVWWGDNTIPNFPKFVLDAEVVSINPNISTEIGNRGVITETELQAIAALFALNSEDSIKIQKDLDQPIRFRVFDCLYYENEDIKHLPYFKRRKIAKEIVEMLQNAGLPFTVAKAIRKHKMEYLEYIWDEGGEGCVAKNIYAKYIPTKSRPRTGWIKFKRTTSGALGDSIDAFVIGFELGDPNKGFANLIGSLTMGVEMKFKDGTTSTHPIAKIINIQLVERKQITVLDENGEPSLDPDYYNKVGEIEGQAVSARARRLTHPRLLRWRDDKSPHECTMKEIDLDSLIM